MFRSCFIRGGLACPKFGCEVSERPLKKRLAGKDIAAQPTPVISGLTGPQGFVFSLVPEPQDLECTDFSGGVANGGRASFRWSSFWVIAAWTSTVSVEADLAARSNAALKDTVLDKTRIAVDGRDVTFAADAFSEDGRVSAVASVEAVPGVRLVDDETRLVPEAKPFVWSAERDVVRVTLGGSSPLPVEQGKTAGGGPRQSWRRRGGRPDEPVARRAAALR